MGINLFHDFVIAPAADLHGDLCEDTEVGGEGGKTMAELVDSDALDAGAVAGTLDGAAERHYDALQAISRRAYGRDQWRREAPV